MKAQFIRGKWWVAYSGPVHLNGIRAPLIHVFVHFCCRLFLHTLSNRRLFVCVLSKVNGTTDSSDCVILAQ